MRTGHTEISEALRRTTAGKTLNVHRLIGALAAAVLSFASTTAYGTTDIGDIPYGTINEQTLTLRIFYVIVPSTQLNEVVTGTMIIPYWIKNGYSKPTPTHPSVGVPVYHNMLGASCDRTGKEQVTWNCLNGALKNAQKCTNALKGSTQYWKLGSGHKVTSKQQHDMSNQIMEDINSKNYVDAIIADFTESQWAKPGKHVQTLRINQPGNEETIWDLGGDADYLGAYCLYDLYPGYTG